MHAPHWRRSVCLRWLLVLSLWQGPIPVLHAHDTLADAAAESVGWLASHLERHHTAIDPFAAVDFGWHVHLEVPESEGEPSESPGPSVRLPAVVAVSDATLGDSSFHVVWNTMGVADGAAIARKAVGASAASGLRPRERGFFSAYAAALALPLRLGVARC